LQDIFRRYPNRYESIIATLCDNLESLDEPEAKASMIWIIGEEKATDGQLGVEEGGDRPASLTRQAVLKPLLRLGQGGPGPTPARPPQHLSRLRTTRLLNVGARTRLCSLLLTHTQTHTHVTCTRKQTLHAHIQPPGEYAERIDNADELLETFLETFPEETAPVQLQLLTATVKLFLKKPTEVRGVPGCGAAGLQSSLGLGGGVFGRWLWAARKVGDMWG
jgi:hypothetical protein